jgi:hypothetical protein
MVLSLARAWGVYRVNLYIYLSQENPTPEIKAAHGTH